MNSTFYMNLKPCAIQKLFELSIFINKDFRLTKYPVTGRGDFYKYPCPFQRHLKLDVNLNKKGEKDFCDQYWKVFCDFYEKFTCLVLVLLALTLSK